jgi:hypothetical protein
MSNNSEDKLLALLIEKSNLDAKVKDIIAMLRNRKRELKLEINGTHNLHYNSVPGKEALIKEINNIIVAILEME